MNTSRADRVAIAHRLSTAMRRTPGDTLPDTDTGDAPRGNCGRDPSAACGMIDRSECIVHADPPDTDPALLAFSGTLQMRRAQLKAARRRGLRF